MKKIFAIFALAVMLMVPMSSFAATTVSDSDLATITGQSGVSIDLNVTVNMSADVIAWGDSDGLQIIQSYDTLEGDETYHKAGYVGLQNMVITGLQIKMRDFSDVEHGGPQANETEWHALNTLLANYDHELALAGNGSANNASSAHVALLTQSFITNNRYNSALTIDVGTNDSGKTIVSIGVPSFDITLGSMTANVALFAEKADASYNPNKIQVQTDTAQVLGSLNVNNLTALFWGGRIDISAEDPTGSKQGVDISLKNVLIERIGANGISWGDADGVVGGLNTFSAASGGAYGNYSSAGYVGISGQNMFQNLKLNGELTIDVASIDVAALNAIWNTGGHAGAGASTVVTMALASVTYTQTQMTEYEIIYAGKKILGYDMNSVGLADRIAYVHIGIQDGFNINIEKMYMPVVLWNTPDLANSYLAAKSAGETATHELGVVYAKNLNVTIVNGPNSVGIPNQPSYVNILAH